MTLGFCARIYLEAEVVQVVSEIFCRNTLKIPLGMCQTYREDQDDSKVTNL